MKRSIQNYTIEYVNSREATLISCCKKSLAKTITRNQHSLFINYLTLQISGERVKVQCCHGP